MSEFLFPWSAGNTRLHAGDAVVARADDDEEEEDEDDERDEEEDEDEENEDGEDGYSE